MGILDDVVINVKSAAEVVGKKAGQIVDVSKLRINISEINGEIAKRYNELGQYIYNCKKCGEMNESELADRITAIDELYVQLNAIVKEIDTLQNKVTCSVCGKQCSCDSSFCSYCGAKLKKEEPEACCCGCEAPAEEQPTPAEEQQDGEEK